MLLFRATLGYRAAGGTGVARSESKRAAIAAGFHPFSTTRQMRCSQEES
jgi:hypothetical protein